LTVSGLGEVTSLAAGGKDSFALLKSGVIDAWGSNGLGELGLGGLDSKVPEPEQIPGLTGVRAVSAGHKFTLALLANGTVMSWGVNQYGQLGTGTTEASIAPVHVKNLTGVKQIAAGGFFHSLALLEDGTVVAWGNGRYGDLGNGTIEDSYVPVPVTGLSNVVAVSAGGIHSLALLRDGTVESWGGNEYAQLGHGPRNTKRTDLPEPVRGLSEVKAIEAGMFFNLALLRNGTVMAWGYDHSGQLGNGTANTVVNGTPTPVSGLTNVVAISASKGAVGSDRRAQHAMAKLGNGALYAWGGDEFGELGIGSTEPALTPKPIPGLGSGSGSGIETFAAGGFFSLAAP
jgi:alpha-tubulin suppressor-like RCC1 family protein